MALIEAHGLVKQYNGRRRILDGIDLVVDAGEFALLCGRSGCGKTTLLNILGGLDRPNEGTVRIDGVETTGLSEDGLAKLRRHSIGFVFQDFNLLPDLTVFQNVALPLQLTKTPPGSRVAHLLEVFEISELARERANTLSGGEAQRVAMARALANNPKLLLADEPTGNLDPETATVVMQFFEKTQQEFGTSIILSSHNPALAKWASRTLTLADGKLAPSNGE